MSYTRDDQIIETVKLVNGIFDLPSDKAACARFSMPEFEDVWFWLQVRKDDLQGLTGRAKDSPPDERCRIFIKCYSLDTPNVENESFTISTATVPVTQLLVELLAAPTRLRAVVLIPALLRLSAARVKAGHAPLVIPKELMDEQDLAFPGSLVLDCGK